MTKKKPKRSTKPKPAKDGKWKVENGMLPRIYRDGSCGVTFYNVHTMASSESATWFRCRSIAEAVANAPSKY